MHPLIDAFRELLRGRCMVCVMEGVGFHEKGYCTPTIHLNLIEIFILFKPIELCFCLIKKVSIFNIFIKFMLKHLIH